MATNYTDGGWTPFQVGSVSDGCDDDCTDRQERRERANRDDHGPTTVTNTRSGNARVGRQYDGDVTGPIDIRM